LEVLQLSLVDLEPWLEDEAMISKWENPSTWVRNEKEKKLNEKWKMKKKKKWGRKAPIYIVPTHKTKLLGSNQRLWIAFLHKVEDFDLGWHSWFRDLIMKGGTG
jgi:hypothetical protein